MSLELLTVLGAGPLALWICWGIARGDPMVGVWMVVLATGELYGGMFRRFLLPSFPSLNPLPIPQSNPSFLICPNLILEEGEES